MRDRKLGVAQAKETGGYRLAVIRSTRPGSLGKLQAVPGPLKTSLAIPPLALSGCDGLIQ